MTQLKIYGESKMKRVIFTPIERSSVKSEDLEYFDNNIMLRFKGLLAVSNPLMIPGIIDVIIDGKQSLMIEFPEKYWAENRTDAEAKAIMANYAPARNTYNELMGKSVRPFYIVE